MPGSTYTIQPGDTIIRIAFDHHFRSWEALWEHPENAPLRDLRSNPHVLAPGDVLFIPDKTPKEFPCGTYERHTFRLREMVQYLQQTFLDENGHPLAGKTYELKVAGKTIRNATDGQGVLREPVPISAKSAELTLWLVEGDDDQSIVWTLQLGHLDPVDSAPGLSARLTNLGFLPPSGGGSGDDDTRAALRKFQTQYGLAVSGESDEATRAKLIELHDRPLESA